MPRTVVAFFGSLNSGDWELFYSQQNQIRRCCPDGVVAAYRDPTEFSRLAQGGSGKLLGRIRQIGEQWRPC